jgi:head-tail adaptor
MEIGDLRDRVTFAQPASSTDEYGNVESGFEDQFTVAASILYVRGGEQVMAARLEGRQPVVLTIRSSSQSEQIGPGWKATDARDDSRIFNIRSIQPGDRKDFTELLCEMGVAV